MYLALGNFFFLKTGIHMQLLNVEPIVYNLWERETLETNRNDSLHNSPVETVSLTAPDCHEMLQLIPDCLSQAPSDPECPMLHLYSFLVMCFLTPCIISPIYQPITTFAV